MDQQPITSIQPGGGWCMSLELLWGRIRRGYLRVVWPGYVRRMAEKRQGSCPNCPHDIIDSRDLKFYRNVCGFWFRPEDDAFRWRDNIGLAREGLAEVLIFSFLILVPTFAVAWLALDRPILWILVGMTGALWLQTVLFFRNPRRSITDDPRAVVSPADGTITEVGEIDDPDFPNGRAFRVSIFLSIFNVHVNRVPRTGKILSVRYYPGAFLDARHPECARRNEQLWIDMEDGSTRQLVRVKKISGAIARRIVCWLKGGDEVTRGERSGMIKFGSRTEILVAASAKLELLVKIGDTVQGGSTVLMRWNDG